MDKRLNLKKNSLLRKFKGYNKAPRDRFLLLYNGTLTQEEFIVYEFVAAITDWDQNHDTFGTFKATNVQIANALGWKDDSTVSRYRRSLVKKGLLIKIEDGFYQVSNFEAWLVKPKETDSSKPESFQDQSALPQTESADKLGESAGMQTFPSYISKNSLVSSKGGLNVSRKKLNESLSDEELDFIAKQIDNASLTSLKTEESPKTLDQMSFDEMLNLGIEIFGVGTRLEEANG